jgi:transcriptional regulator with GAF, ATPase, and Fis domain
LSGAVTDSLINTSFREIRQYGEIGHAPPESPRVATLDEAERAHIIKVLESVDWRVSGDQGAAVLLGVPATTLRSRIERLGIQKPRA